MNRSPGDTKEADAPAVLNRTSALCSQMGRGPGVPKRDEAFLFPNGGTAHNFHRGQRPQASHNCGGRRLVKGVEALLGPIG